MPRVQTLLQHNVLPTVRPSHTLADPVPEKPHRVVSSLKGQRAEALIIAFPESVNGHRRLPRSFVSETTANAFDCGPRSPCLDRNSLEPQSQKRQASE
jgi:hypothetical protein